MGYWFRKKINWPFWYQLCAENNYRNKKCNKPNFSFRTFWGANLNKLWLTVSSKLGWNYNAKLLVCISNQVATVNVKATCLKSPLTTRLNKLFESLSPLQKIIISEPTDVEQLPDFISVKQLEFSGIPRNISTWKWLICFRSLEAITVSFKNKGNSEIPDSNASSGKDNEELLRVESHKAECNSLSSDTLAVLENLPSALISKVCKSWPPIHNALINRMHMRYMSWGDCSSWKTQSQYAQFNNIYTAWTAEIVGKKLMTINKEFGSAPFSVNCEQVAKSERLIRHIIFFVSGQLPTMAISHHTCFSFW